MSKANEVQHGGSHYRSDYQHWDWLVDVGFGWQYYAGVATKYLLRHKKKNGLEDLKKARHFVQKLHELITSGKVSLPRGRGRAQAAEDDMLHERLFSLNGCGTFERAAIELIVRPTKAEHLESAMQLIDKLIEHETVAEEMKGSGLRLSANDFIGEGFMANKDMYQCRVCREHIEVPGNTDPSRFHQCQMQPAEDDGSGAGQQYVNQG